MAQPNSSFVSMASTAANAYNIIAASQSRKGGAGKSHFWLTAPDPIFYFLLEPGGLKGLNVNPLFRHKDIRVCDLSGKLDWGRIKDKKERVARGLEVMKEFDAAWEFAKPNARTIVIDKEDMLWETRRYAHDEVESPEPKKFHELNLEHRALIVQAEALGLNLGFIRGMKEGWGKIGVSRATGKDQMGFTGEFTARGHKELDEQVQINLEHRWDEEARLFKVKILDKCRLGEAITLMGEEFDMLEFPELGMKLYPETDIEVWS